jgi:C4-dicarboxylate transporter DctM subunit
MTTLALFVLLFVCLALGLPISLSLGFSSVITILFFSADSLASIALKYVGNLTEHYTLLAIPFFILASSFMTTGGVANRIINFAIDAVGHIRGGLAIASVFACMLFAAVSGSSPATVAAIGSIAIGAMVKSGYPQTMAAGVICNAGTLGILIPPSIVMLVYCAATNVSAAKLFMAGFIPGITLGLFLMAGIYYVARKRGLPALPRASWGKRFKSFVSALGGLMLIIIVLGSIYGGIASPTEAAAVSALYAFLVAVFVYRDMGPLKGVPWKKPGETWGAALGRNVGPMLAAIPRSVTDKDVFHVLLDSAKVTIMLLFIIANAMLFAHVLTTERIPHLLAETIVGWGLPDWGFLVVVNVLLLIAGNFMEPSAILLIMAPILFPISQALEINPLHLGIIMVVNMEIGMITPPVGLNLYVTSAITGRPLTWVVKAALPWLMILLAFLVFTTYVPIMSTFLPDFLDSLKGYK